MIDIYKILYEICEDEKIYDPDCELIDSGILDSYAFIELFATLEDYDIEIYPTQVDRAMLKTPRLIEQLIKSYMQED